MAFFNWKRKLWWQLLFCSLCVPGECWNSLWVTCCWLLWSLLSLQQRYHLYLCPGLSVWVTVKAPALGRNSVAGMRTSPKATFRPELQYIASPSSGHVAYTWGLVHCRGLIDGEWGTIWDAFQNKNTWRCRRVTFEAEPGIREAWARSKRGPWVGEREEEWRSEARVKAA